VSEQQPDPPGTVVGQISITAEAEVIPGPETLAAQAAAATDDDEEPEAG
jgi:hypothetical protein